MKIGKPINFKIRSQVRPSIWAIASHSVRAQMKGELWDSIRKSLAIRIDLLWK